MIKQNKFEVIIIGGSYAGLSAAMALGRSLRQVLVVDAGEPCNRQTPHSHNFITHDGETPAAIAAAAREQVLKYNNVQFATDTVTDVQGHNNRFKVYTAGGKMYRAQKILFATGVKDVMPDIPGFAESWGISVLHCPYCHGYEVRHKHLGVMANGQIGFEFTKLIHNLSPNLTLFTDGPSQLTTEQTRILKSKGINTVKKRIGEIRHNAGHMSHIVFDNGTEQALDALFARVAYLQHTDIPQRLGCTLNEAGYIAVDDFQRTTVKGIYAAGDNTSMFRSVAAATASGNKAGAMMNKDLVDENF